MVVECKALVPIGFRFYVNKQRFWPMDLRKNVLPSDGEFLLEMYHPYAFPIAVSWFSVGWAIEEGRRIHELFEKNGDNSTKKPRSRKNPRGYVFFSSGKHTHIISPGQSQISVEAHSRISIEAIPWPRTENELRIACQQFKFPDFVGLSDEALRVALSYVTIDRVKYWIRKRLNTGEWGWPVPKNSVSAL